MKKYFGREDLPLRMKIHGVQAVKNEDSMWKNQTQKHRRMLTFAEYMSDDIEFALLQFRADLFPGRRDPDDLELLQLGKRIVESRIRLTGCVKQADGQWFRHGRQLRSLTLLPCDLRPDAGTNTGPLEYRIEMDLAPVRNDSTPPPGGTDGGEAAPR